MESRKLKNINGTAQPLDAHQLLWPCPQRICINGDTFYALPQILLVQLVQPTSTNNDTAHSMIVTWNQHKGAFEALGYQLMYLYLEETPPTIVCCLNRELFHENESYTLAVKDAHIHLSASDIPALNHAIRTFLQIITIYKKQDGLPNIRIRDWPSLSHRALQIDVSTNSAKVPNLETLHNMIDMWSRLKMNQLHLFRNLDSSSDCILPYSAIEMLELESFCRDRCISLVPSVELTTLGGLEAVLIIKAFLKRFTNFKFLAVGEILVQALCTIGDICDLLPVDLTRVTLMIPETSVDLLPTSLRQRTVTILDVKQIVLPQEHTSTTCICARINPLNENSICGFNSMSRLESVLRYSTGEHHLGMVVCGSNTHHWAWPVSSLAPTLLALGLAWNPGMEVLMCTVGELLNLHLVSDEGNCLGQILTELGSVEESCPTLLLLLEDPDAADIENCTGHLYQRILRQLVSCQSQLHGANLYCPQSGEILAQVQLLIDLLMFAARIGKSLVTVGTNPNSNFGVCIINVGLANLPATAKTDLANKLLGLIEQFRVIWLSGHLPNNLQSSLLKLTNLLNHLVPQDMIG